MTVDPVAIAGFGVAFLTLLGVVAVAMSNTVYSKPRIEALERDKNLLGRRVRDLEDKAGTDAAVLIERDKRINLLEEMVKSVPAFGQLVIQVTALTTAAQSHEDRSAQRDEHLVTVLNSIAARLERKSDHRTTD